VDRVIFVLEWPFHRNELCIRNCAAVALKEFLGHDDIEDIRLIRDRHEDGTLGCARPLLDDGQTCNPNELSIPSLPQFKGSEISLLIEFLPAEVHRVRSSSHACPRVVDYQTLFRCHFSQWKAPAVFA